MLSASATAWPATIRQWKMSPIAGGWTATYVSGDLEVKAAARNPHGTVRNIANILAANKKDIDIDDIRYQLEVQWFKRDPRRFTRPPQEPQGESYVVAEVGLPNTKVMGAVSGFLNLSYRSDLSLEIAAPILLQIFDSKEIGCDACCSIIRAIAKEAPEDWRYEIQKELCGHLGLPVMPKPLIAKSWLI